MSEQDTPDIRTRSSVVDIGTSAAATDFDITSLFATDETVTVYLFPASPERPKGVYVTLKRQVDYGESVAVEAALIKGLAPDEAQRLAQEAERRGSGTIIVDTGRQKLLKLATWIHDWNLPGPSGKTVVWPSKPHERLTAVASLNPKVGEWLEQQIDKLILDADAVNAADAEDEKSGPLSLSSAAGKRGATSRS